MNDLINIEDLFGWVQLVSTQERRGTRIYMGGYSIRYGRDGNERSRTENTWNCYVECGDGKTTDQMLRLSAPTGPQQE